MKFLGRYISINSSFKLLSKSWNEYYLQSHPIQFVFNFLSFSYLTVKPTISLESAHTYEKGMIINCTLEKRDINPPQVNFTWYSCDTSKCDKKKLINESYSLHLKNQPKPEMNYRCEAKNDAGTAYKDIVVRKGESCAS